MTRRRVPLRIADDFVDEGLRDLVRETAGAKTLKEFQAGIDRHNRNRTAASPETLQAIRQGLAESADVVEDGGMVADLARAVRRAAHRRLPRG